MCSPQSLSAPFWIAIDAPTVTTSGLSSQPGFPSSGSMMLFSSSMPRTITIDNRDDQAPDPRDPQQVQGEEHEVAADHVEFAMGEVEHLHRAPDQREAARDGRVHAS